MYGGIDSKSSSKAMLKIMGDNGSRSLSYREMVTFLTVLGPHVMMFVVVSV